MYKFLIRAFCTERYTKHKIKTQNFVDIRLDRYISAKFNLPWSVLQKHFRKNDFFVIRGEGAEKLKDPGVKLQLNDSIYVSKVVNRVEKEETNDDNLNVEEKGLLRDLFNQMNVFNCKEFIILDKMCNIASQGGTGLKFSIDTMLRLHNKGLRLIHRLDRNVTGLMVVGNDINFVRKMGDDLKNSKVEKIYLALCQDFPLYLKHMISEKRIHPSNSNLFKSCLSGLIKSNENGDRYIIEMANNYNFVHLDNISITKTLSKSVQGNEFDMIGKFKITHLIYFDKNTKKYYTYDLNMLDNLKENERERFLFNCEAIVDSYTNGSTKHFECFTLCYYELISGKKHQIRKHMGRSFMTPIFNDEEYLFDKELSPQTYKRYYDEFSGGDGQDLLKKYKINNFMHSILLHSLQLGLPYGIENYKAKKSIGVKQENNKTIIRSQEVPDNFKLLFKSFDIKLDDIINNSQIIKL
jgi:23S rRNA-/tRNA-specific pseudouridylate synthase